MSNVLRSLPTVSELLESPQLKSLVSRVSHNVVVTRASQFLDDLRGQLQTATGVNIPTPSELAERIAKWIAHDRGGLKSVLNATGVILHPQLAGPPLPVSAVAALADVAGGFAPLHFDMNTGQAGDRDDAAQTLLCRLTGAEAAHVAGTHAGAALALLAAIGSSRGTLAPRAEGQGEVLVARSQIGHVGGRKLTELVALAGATLKEVGTTHQATTADFAAAIGSRTTAILLPTAADYAIVGATQQATLADLVPLARKHNLPLIHDLGLGGLIDMTRFGLPDQPVAQRSIEAGADLALLSGNKLLGGPECGIVVGKRALVQRLREHSLSACLPAGSLALAALAATLRLYDDSESIERTIPLFALLSTPIENLKNRAERIGPQIVASGVASVEILEAETSLAGQIVPGQMLRTVRLALTPTSGTSAMLAAALRQTTPAVIATLDGARLLLDLRSIPPSGDIGLVTAIESLAAPKPAAPPTSPPSPSTDLPPLTPA
jgi:L-seryl-tRNA(Ser) seleniumtransferase